MNNYEYAHKGKLDAIWMRRTTSNMCALCCKYSVCCWDTHDQIERTMNEKKSNTQHNIQTSSMYGWEYAIQNEQNLYSFFFVNARDTI